MARRLSMSDSSSAPAALRDQTFEILCHCGEKLTGPRKLHHQSPACSRCGKMLFVLPFDCYAGQVPRRSRRPMVLTDKTGSAGVIDKLNRLAFWTRLREGRTNLGGQLYSIARRAGRWLKGRLSLRR